ncbi:MAG: chromate transporter [Clostridiaceae bacterium]|jgi:chromate transporter|nr:chromate transporter [Clostridiaceae bacterium]
MILYIKLFLEFFRIGLFSFGGGYATIPFLYHLISTEKWFTSQQLSDMIALSSITPGPVGVNMATFAGYTTSGIKGALIATVAIVLPSFIICLIVAKLLEAFRTNKYTQTIIYVLKPVSCGLLAAVGIKMFIDNLNLLGLLLFGFFLYLTTKEKRDPLFYLAISALVGLIAGFFNLVD